MKITSRASDYALLLTIYLASLKDNETASVKKVASHHGLSLRFLANISNKLGLAHLTVSSRGVAGGIKLAKPASQISVRDVIEAVDGPVQTMFCQNTEENCVVMTHCHMKHFWDDIQNSVMDKLTKTTIDDLAHQQMGSSLNTIEPIFV